MPQSSTPSLVAFLLLAGICRTAAGQAIAEYGLGAGRASTTTAPARNLGKQLGGVLDSPKCPRSRLRTTQYPDSAV